MEVIEAEGAVEIEEEDVEELVAEVVQAEAHQEEDLKSSSSHIDYLESILPEVHKTLW